VTKLQRLPLILQKKMGKTPVEVKKDTPGFIVNRIMLPHMLEAIKIVEEGIASVEDVDTAVKMGLNYPMGPFELMDLSGIDIALFVSNYFFKEMNKEIGCPYNAEKHDSCRETGEKNRRRMVRLQ